VEVRLRQVRQGPDGIAEYADAEVSAEALTIGSAPDQTVQLLGKDVAAQHAVIRLAGSVMLLTARRRARLLVNGERSSSARLKPGDVVQIGGNRILVTPAPPGFDLALTIEPDMAVQKSELERAFRTDLERTWLSKRGSAWALLLLTPLLIFLIPLGTTLLHREARSTPVWLPDESLWSAGPLIPAHAQAAGEHCEACHRAFFLHVQDQECRKCHENVVDHVTAAHQAQTRLGPPGRCGECHEEHNSHSGSLVVRADSLCASCHAHSTELFGSLQLMPVSGFSQRGHPAFKATVLRPVPVRGGTEVFASLEPARPTASGAEQLVWQATRVPVAGGLESSNLKFSHRQHLDGRQVPPRRAGRPALTCSDCHVLQSDGAHFAPITMAGSCAGAGCHELSFDRKAPDRQLPHGKPRDAILLIEDYYAHRSLESSAQEEVSTRRRLPDEAAAPTQSCQGPPAARGACRAALEIINQFTRQGCVSCHQVTDSHDAVLSERFTVRPVRLVSDYLPGVHFSHRTHGVQKNLTGQAACLSCHAAQLSNDTAQLMIPDKGKCLACHSDTAARDRVELRCISCHAYHADRSERPSQHT